MAPDKSPAFPTAEEGDTDDVAWALETGRSMWVRGEYQDAMRWLSRAADSAAEAGAEQRSQGLLVRATELRCWVAEQMRVGCGDDQPLTGIQTWVVDDDDGAAAVEIAESLTGQITAEALGAPPLPAELLAEDEMETVEQGPAVAAELVRLAEQRAALDRLEATAVSVEPADGKPGVYLARALGAGERPDPDAGVGLLLPLDPTELES